MNRGEYLEYIIKEKGYTIRSLSRESGVAYTTIRSMIERNLKNASIDNVIKVCRVLGIKADDLSKEEYDIEDIKKQQNEKDELPELNSKDEKSIQEELQKIIDGLSSDSGYAAFDGETLDDLDEEDRELLIASLENSLRLAKRLAKQKFTPKKHRR
ncbi:MAG TPA: helix-turn-helix transcriptional regulator [Bacillus sp. (in: firmicutes)]|nr:helix-turn-helix transcriptional regulator [Bacillus sp. (in: firmicutes)]